MYTIKDYVVDLKQSTKNLEDFLTTLDKECVHAILEQVVQDNFLEIHSILSSYENYDRFNAVQQKMTIVGVIAPTEDPLTIKANTLLAKVLCTVIYCKIHADKDITNEINFIIKSFSELNPHKEHLRQIYEAVNNGDYNDYLMMMSLDTACFLRYQHTVIKAVYNMEASRVQSDMIKELRVALLADGKDIVGLRYLKAFYEPPTVEEGANFSAILLYEGGNLFEADPKFSAKGMSSFFAETANLNQQVLDTYPENADLQIKVTLDVESIEPIYLNNPEEGANYTNVNYPFVLVETNKLREMLL